MFIWSKHSLKDESVKGLLLLGFSPDFAFFNRISVIFLRKNFCMSKKNVNFDNHRQLFMLLTCLIVEKTKNAGQ
jgi:hypothetical protein